MTKNYLNLNSETSLFSTFLLFFSAEQKALNLSNSVYTHNLIWNEKLLRSHFCCDLYNKSFQNLRDTERHFKKQLIPDLFE